MMRRSAGFHADEARRQLLKEWQNVPALELTANDYITCRLNCLDLKNRLSDIETNCRDRLHVWLLRIVGALNSTHIHGTSVPVEEPSTASKADSCTAANCAIGCLATLGSSSLPLGVAPRPTPKKDVRCRLAQTSRVRCSNPRGHTMSEFTFLFRGSDPTAQSPEEMQKSMQKWLAWFKELGEKGHIKYPGHPLERAGKVVRGKQKSVHDGPYAEAKDIVNGFTLIEAKDLPHAVELSKRCPILEAGGSVEVRPIRILDM